MTIIKVKIHNEKHAKVAANTAYYRKNKKQRKTVHSCPHCNYETTGPKCILENHIHAKHTQECNKPFHCRFCEKGFSQKAHLQNHLMKIHDIPEHIAKPPVKSKNIFVYLIELTGKKAKSKSTLARINIYRNNKKLFAKDLSTFKIDNNKQLKPHNIHYDANHGYISLTTKTEDEYMN